MHSKRRTLLTPSDFVCQVRDPDPTLLITKRS